MSQDEVNKFTFADPVVEGQSCATCKNWLKRDAEPCTFWELPNGAAHWVPNNKLRSMLVSQGRLREMEGTHQKDVAPCILNPQWIPQPENHFCLQWSQKLDG